MRDCESSKMTTKDEHEKSQGSSVVCAIHQPNFFPWLGYFDKIRQADVFVILDNVDYPKSGSSMGSWTNRVKVAIQGKPAWIRCPVKRQQGIQKIADVQIDQSQRWQDKLLRTLEMNYAKATNYPKAMTLLEPLIRFSTESLVEFNLNAIVDIKDYLGINCEFVTQSSLGINSRASELLTDLSEAVGASVYLCGGGASGYQDDSLFEARGLTLRYQQFAPEPYGDFESWLPGLSVIDWLMKDGSASGR